MSRQRILAVVLLLACRAARGQGTVSETSTPAEKPAVGVTSAGAVPAPLRLTFIYPCMFVYSDGKLYEERVMDFECDYMHASIKNADKTFDDLPTPEAQKAFLDHVTKEADGAHNEYIKKVAAVIAKTDPAKLPKTLTQSQRLTAMAALNVELSTGVFEAAAPFLWPPREGDSYLQKTAGPWPKSWTPYIQPIYDRSGELQGMVRDSEMKLIDKASADLEAKLKLKGLTPEALKKADSGAALDNLFDGGAGKGVVAGPPSGPGPDVEPAKRVTGASPEAPISDLKTAEPPIPADDKDRSQRNYFARGTAAGLSRLNDDAHIAMWHATGQTTTVGDPYGKARLIFHQSGPSCDVSAQAEALHARGKNVPVDKLAQEGYDKGLYVEYETVSGARDGGTPWESVNSLLTLHGVPNKLVDGATPAQLDQAVRASGDAITYVKVKAFWNDPTAPDAATHAIYVTGEEVDRAGKVRGYYVNDTGTGEAARYVSADAFDKVWLKKLVVLHP